MRSEHRMERFQYREAGPQLLLQAFLQRVVNSGGRIEREYGLGRMRTDLLVIWPAAAGLAATRRMVIECKRLHRGLEQTILEGLAQTRASMDRCAATQGHLVVFDRTAGKPWEENCSAATRKTGVSLPRSGACSAIRESPGQWRSATARPGRCLRRLRSDIIDRQR